MKQYPPDLDPDPKIPRPIHFSECENIVHPCPWVGCRHHLYLDIGKKGSIKINFPDLEPNELIETCSLRVAGRGESTLDEIGNMMNLSRERIRQVEVKLLILLRELLWD